MDGNVNYGDYIRNKHLCKIVEFFATVEYTDTAGRDRAWPTAYQNIEASDTMPVEVSKKGLTKRSYISVRFRLRGKRKTYRFLNELAGANRYLWNAALAQCRKDYAETGKSKTARNSLYNWYKQHKDTEAPWLSKYPVALTRTGLQGLSVAYREFFMQPKRGHPKFKKKGKAKKTFAVEISSSPIKQNGYFRLKQGLFAKMMDYDRINRYSNPVPKSARIFEDRGKWYITVAYEVDAVACQADGIGVGVDRNVGQVADSTGQVHRLTDVERLEKRIKNLQRRQARRKNGSCKYSKTKRTIARHKRKIANIRRNDHRHIARDITNCSTLVLLEALKTKGMTASAKGTVQAPGKNVKQKAGLNRGILGTAWSILEGYLGERGFVHKINPAYTSQTCSKCGYMDAKNRVSQAVFRCQRCEHFTNADVNAALNIRASGMASLNGSGAYVRPVLAERKPAIGHRVMKEQLTPYC